MKIRFFFCFFIVFVTATQTYGDDPQSANKLFLKSVISYLNQSAKVDKSINKNLFKLYEAELKETKSLWEKNVDSAKMTRRKKNLSINQFYLSEISKKNKESAHALAKLSKPEIDDVDAVAADVFQKVVDFNKSISQQTKKRQQQEIGFCFSRALLVHYLLLKKKVPHHQIKKIFAVGPIFRPPTLWKFHVATFIDVGYTQFVIDPLQKKPLTILDWQKEVLKWSAENPFPRLRFYITDPRKFLPNSGAYSLSTLSHPYIEVHSKEMANFLQKESQLD